MKKIAGIVGVISLIIGLIAGVIEIVNHINRQSTPLKPAIPTSATIIRQYSIQVSSNKYLDNTEIQVKKGDWLEFSAIGSWWSGISQTGPEGDGGGIFGIGRPPTGQTLIPDANNGELVGLVNGGTPFRVGSSAIQIADRDGNLILVMNESLGSCEGGGVGSCYDDNNGSLAVKVTVWRL